jgi:uncharacterized membrane protein
MPSEIGNQSVRGGGGAQGNTFVSEEAPNRLVVVSFPDHEQAEGLYADLVALDKSKVLRLEDAVFVTKNEAGEYTVDEKFHHEKRTGMLKGAGVGVVVGLIIGGPVLGLAGGAIVGRMIGNRVDLGVDEGTVKSIAEDLENGHTALFLLGAAKHQPTVVDVFKKYNGKIIQTNIDADAQQKLQRALDSHEAESE